MKRVCVVTLGPPDAPSETFIRAHVRYLPAETALVYGSAPHVSGRPVLSPAARAFTKLRSALSLSRRATEEARTRAYRAFFQRFRPHAALGEYGPTAVSMLDACRAEGVPLIAHFHGYDASVRDVVEKHRDGYRRVFAEAKAVIAVSKQMKQALVAMGAPEGTTHVIPCGAEVANLQAADPARAPMVALAVGRFVEKKAPHLTLLAFARVLERAPGARLRMIGDGPLLGACKALARGLRVEEAVSFLGSQPHEEVQREMSAARVFVQCSVTAMDGDMEGTPVAVVEAQAAGLPVVATRHGGIPDVVLEEQTGLLVDEADITAMADHLARLFLDGERAERLGRAGRERAMASLTVEASVARLWSVIDACS
jgi:colanic acid/amylovoran biosynthesis glycosyltransferase